MIIRVMRDCGHEVADPPITVDSYDDIFEKKPDEELRYPTIGTLYPQEYQLIEVIYPYRKLSYEQFIQQGEEYIQRVRNRSTQIVWHVYKIPREKFARIEQKLMALDLLKETMPVTRRMQDYSQHLRFHINVPYEAWYYVPPRYQRGNGFGLRYDQELHARVMDINFDSDTALGYKFITLVEGD